MYKARHFNPTDAEYQIVADLYNAANPDNPQTTVASMKEDDDEWEEGYLNQQYIVENAQSTIVAAGGARELFWAYKPGEVHFMFDIHPDYTDPSIADVFYHYLVEQLQARTPALERLIIGFMEDNLDRIQYVESKGFVVRERDAKSALQLQNVDMSSAVEREERALAQGIRIYTLAEVKELVPDWKIQLHQLRNTLDQDVSGVGLKMETTLEQFERMFLQDPALDLEAWWIAVDESKGQREIEESEDRKHDNQDHLDLGPSHIGEFIGYSNLWINDETRKQLDTGMTGVLRSHRRRGIATLLKYKAIAYGQRHNSDRIVTSNEENNPMLELNNKFGFEPIPGWISYEKIFQTEK
ncbi:GNAT family N-acetyltransferase [Chloroflexi bacterium TSY]|nr:GNAT family N-acetyltransferase [Chloroflexi bacterium TSY]